MSDGQPGTPLPPPLIELLPEPGGPGHTGSIYAVAPRPRERRLYGRAGVLFALTFLCATTLSPVMVQLCRADLARTLVDKDFSWLTPGLVAAVWRDPALLKLGLAFSLPALFILFCHEMGHYVACRIYGIPCTPPFFLPSPVNFGTFGAFIRIKAPIQSKRQLFDVGIAGPIAGFVALIPFLGYGIAHSRASLPASGDLLLPGRSLAIQLATRLFHGPLAPGMILNLHPTALAAWLGLFATALNLLPLGQLDGGHILYAATGALQRRLALPFWLGLALLGYFWPGWLLWSVIVLVIGLRHPPVYDESVPLDPKRKVLAWVALALFVLSFMPVPIQFVTVP
ncbi:MAG TPA: site-2 protease family protein [Thermoanaerobaculia bacterium]|jgi:membrane-associated protease RseP (regulator of RpoE activity)|nr:site-2 protease family protein [Thermoanaerobaculia bacterium]